MEEVPNRSERADGETPSSLKAPDGYESLGFNSIVWGVVTMVLWGGTAVSNQFATDVLGPLFVGGARFGLAAVFMVGWCLVESSPLILKAGQWRLAWWMGVLLFLQIGTFNVGLFHSTSSHASILVNSYIFWVAAYEHFIQRSIRLRWWQIIGLVLAAAGCCLLLMSANDGPQPGSRDTPTFYGDSILVISGMILAMKVLYTKHSVRYVSPGPLILWHDIIGTALFFVSSAAIGETMRGPMTTDAVLGLLYGGLIVSGLCFGIHAMMLRKHGASQVSVFSFGTPICGVALGVLLRGDRITPWLILAGILAACGIYLVNRAPKTSD